MPLYDYTTQCRVTPKFPRCSKLKFYLAAPKRTVKVHTSGTRGEKKTTLLKLDWKTHEYLHLHHVKGPDMQRGEGVG